MAKGTKVGGGISPEDLAAAHKAAQTAQAKKAGTSTADPSSPATIQVATKQVLRPVLNKKGVLSFLTEDGKKVSLSAAKKLNPNLVAFVEKRLDTAGKDAKEGITGWQARQAEGAKLNKKYTQELKKRQASRIKPKPKKKTTGRSKDRREWDRKTRAKSQKAVDDAVQEKNEMKGGTGATAAAKGIAKRTREQGKVNAEAVRKLNPSERTWLVEKGGLTAKQVKNVRKIWAAPAPSGAKKTPAKKTPVKKAATKKAAKTPAKKPLPAAKPKAPAKPTAATPAPMTKDFKGGLKKVMARVQSKAQKGIPSSAAVGAGVRKGLAKGATAAKTAAKVTAKTAAKAAGGTAAASGAMAKTSQMLKEIMKKLKGGAKAAPGAEAGMDSTIAAVKGGAKVPQGIIGSAIDKIKGVGGKLVKDPKGKMGPMMQMIMYYMIYKLVSDSSDEFLTKPAQQAAAMKKIPSAEAMVTSASAQQETQRANMAYQALMGQITGGQVYGAAPQRPALIEGEMQIGGR